MQRLSLASIAITTILAGPGLAADLPVKARPAPPAAVVAYSWSGFYVGANLGGAWLDKKVTETEAETGNFPVGLANPVGFSQSLKAAGVAGGMQAGYNWHVDRWLFGLEADFNFTGIKKAIFFEEPGVTPPDDTLRAKVPWFATLRARFGIPYDRWLPYVTGGLAIAHFKQDYGDTDTGGSLDPLDAATIDKVRVGWTVGGGLEFVVGGNWTMKAEYLYMQFESFTLRPIDPTDGGAAELRDRMHVARIGLNYRFGAPVVARY